MFETFDHTADLGLRIQAPDLDTLFAEAGRALFTTIVEDLATIRFVRKIDLQLPREEREFLLFDWLTELLYQFESEHLLFGRFEVRISDAGLTGAAWGEALDRNRHVLAHEVKAITYHGLMVEPTASGWIAEVIVDI